MKLVPSSLFFAMASCCQFAHAAVVAGRIGPFDSKMPEHSWDTLPVAYHGASYDPSPIALRPAPTLAVIELLGSSIHWRARPC